MAACEIAAKSSLLCERKPNMAKSMTKSEIIGTLAEKTGLQKKQVAQFFDELAALAYREAPSGFTLPGLGKLVLVERAARMGRNPKTGEPIHIAAKRTLKFRLAKEAKDAAAAMGPVEAPAAPVAEAPAMPAIEVPPVEAPAMPAMEVPPAEAPAS
jgi:DNA-binding protein HU-beta